MSHIFISYSKQNKAYAYALADFLQAHGFNIWIDRSDIEYGVDWWDAIVEGLRGCAAFLVVMTPESKASEWVKREVFLALQQRKAVFPLLLNGDNWELFVLTQYADVTDGAMPDGDLLKRMGEHVTPHGTGENKSRLIPADTPPAPSTAAPLEARFNVDAAINEFGTAFRARNWSEALNILGRIRASGEDPSPFDPDALEQRLQKEIEAANRAREEQAWLAERDKQYNRLRVIASYTDSETVWAALQKFWQTFPDYDPDDLAADARPRKLLIPSTKLLPAPFAWIDIPGTLGQKWTGAPYKIAKYPVTNAQFKLFVDAGGYAEPRWWTEAGWEARAKGWVYDNGWKETGKAWVEPRYWRDKQWNGAEQPVVGVSWYEAVAYCLWLSEMTGEPIMLPTEDQWQYAAQGDDGRTYPWGNDWDCKKCNNSVNPCDSNVTTPVRQYEGKGDSPFKVVDMAGNVWEWCLTDYDTQTNDVNSLAERRCLRGGSWNLNGTVGFRCDYRNGDTPHGRYNLRGFRLALS
jgi:hypothetical protein